MGLERPGEQAQCSIEGVGRRTSELPAWRVLRRSCTPATVQAVVGLGRGDTLLPPAVEMPAGWWACHNCPTAAKTDLIESLSATPLGGHTSVCLLGRITMCNYTLLRRVPAGVVAVDTTTAGLRRRSRTARACGSCGGLLRADKQQPPLVGNLLRRTCVNLKTQATETQTRNRRTEKLRSAQASTHIAIFGGLLATVL